MENQRKWKKRAFTLLIIGTVLASLKCIFVSLQMDEEYAISMPYRLLRGDRMFTQLWDPHQTSAFLIEFLMWIWLELFHTTEYVVIFVRVVGTLIHAGVSYLLYRGLCRMTDKEKSLLLAILYYNLLPKTYIMPEFSNMMVWGVTLMLLCLSRLWEMEQDSTEWSGKMWGYIFPAGLFLCFTVLAYPSCVLLYFFIMIFLFRYSRFRGRSMGGITLVCVLLFLGYMGYLFSYMTPAELLENIRSLIASGGAHSQTVLWKLSFYGSDFCLVLLFALGYSIPACLVHRKIRKKYEKKDWRVLGFFLFLISALLIQCAHWLLMLWKYESSYPFTTYFILFGFTVYCIKRDKEKDKAMEFLWLGANLVMFLAILTLTNLSIFTSVKYLMPGVAFSIITFFRYARENANIVYKKFALPLLFLWCFTAAFVKGWSYTDNEGAMENVTMVGNILREGPGKGIITDYMQGYMQNSNYEEFRTYIKPGDNLLVMDSNTLCYLYQDVNIAASTTICTPTFDENLLDYWERNPDKYPDVIAVQCWYGVLKYEPDTWMMQWIEKEFGASQVIDGKYFRYYIR